MRGVLSLRCSEVERVNRLADDVVLLRKRDTGTGAARALRRTGKLPAVVYGKGIEPLAVFLDARESRKILSKPRGYIHRFEVEDSDLKGNVMVQDVEYDAIKGYPVHMDLHRISMTDEVKVEVSIVLNGEEALSKRGLLLQRQLREVSVECLPTDIPESIEVDVSNFNVGDTITAGDLKIPENVKLLTLPAEVVTVVLSPRAADVEKTEAEDTDEEVTAESPE
jgi:large subunit ribosomal protein L25